MDDSGSVSLSVSLPAVILHLLEVHCVLRVLQTKQRPFSDETVSDYARDDGSDGIQTKPERKDQEVCLKPTTSALNYNNSINQ